MPMSTTRDYFLTKIARDLQDNILIADDIFPRLDVEGLTGKYYIWGKERFRLERDLRTGLARANRVDSGMTLASYGPLKEHALEQGIDIDEIREFGEDVARENATRNVQGIVNLNHEKAIADMLSDTAIVTQNATLSGTAQFSDYTTPSDPFGKIQTAIDTIIATGVGRPNTIFMGYPVWTKLRNHPSLLARNGTPTLRRSLTAEQVADLFDVDRIVVGTAMYDTAKEGQTPSLSYVWGKNLWVGYINPSQNPNRTEVSAGYTLQLQDAKYVDRWEETGVKGQFVRSNDYYTPFLVAAEALYLYKNAVA